MDENDANMNHSGEQTGKILKNTSSNIVPSVDGTSTPFSKKQAVDVAFRNVSFHVKSYTWRKPFVIRNEILHGVSGELRAGEVTAIMGPSGAGKSTLLNILAGYTLKGMQGSVYVNGQERLGNNADSFKRLSCYIQQENHLREQLTVHEAMSVAAEFKLGWEVSRAEKQRRIQELLSMLGLSGCLQTVTAHLSGGQKKRLSIAFELISNPPVIFLDEPTTGLDSSSCSQCVSILKLLAQQGRTIVCTIHQPSALIFEMFDKLYTLADGRCLYEGTIRDLLPYLASKGLKCPLYHNPADFLLEVASGEYGSVIDQLVASKTFQECLPDCELHPEERGQGTYCLKTCSVKDSLHRRLEENHDCGSSILGQFYYLNVRNVMIFQKALRFRLTTFMAHLLSSLLLGLTFYNTGNEASMVRSNLSFVFGVLLFLVYMGKMAVTLAVPNEIQVLRVEHFNRWYSLLPYYVSLVMVEIPMQAFNTLVGVTVLYFMSNQPPDFFRFAYFQLFCVVTTITAQALGFFLGATVNIKAAVFVGPVSAATISIFGFTLRFCDTPPIFQGLALMSYFRSAFVSIATTLYGYERGNLDCDELYCHFRSPQKVLHELDMMNINVVGNLVLICSVGVVMHVVTFGVLYVKLNKR